MVTAPKLLALQSSFGAVHHDIATEELAIVDFTVSIYGQTKVNVLSAMFAIEPVQLNLVEEWVVPDVQVMVNLIGEYIERSEHSVRQLLQLKEPVIWKPLEVMIVRIHGRSWASNNTWVRWRHPSLPPS